MKPETLSGFKNGMDLRYLETDTKLQSFWLLQNCHISNGNRIQKRGGMPIYEQLTSSTEGLFPFNGRLWTFQANSDVSADPTAVDEPEIWTITLGHEGTITRVHYVGVLLGGLYCSIEFEVNDGQGGTKQEIAHYYLVTGVDEWSNLDNQNPQLPTGKVYTDDPEGTIVYPVGTINDATNIIDLPAYYQAHALENPVTGAAPPDWLNPDPDGYIIDNDFKWLPVPLLNRSQDSADEYTYNADGVYVLPEYRRNDLKKTWRVWKATNIGEGEVLETDAGGTDAVDWNTEVGSITIDGEVSWECLASTNWVENYDDMEVSFPADEEDPDNQYAHILTEDLANYDFIYRGEWYEVKGGTTEPIWPLEVGDTVQDGDITWEKKATQVLDENCPNTAQVLVLKSKVYAIGSNIGSVSEEDIVRYSATNAPFDWSTERDAGFLATGAQSSGSEIARGLGRYDSRLVVMMEDNIEIWTVDEDPELNNLFQGIGNLGTTYSNTGIGIGTDFLFLSPYGFRSLGAREGSNDFEDTDVGTPIDIPVSNAIDKSVQVPVASLFTSEGQYWCSIGSEIWVWTYSRNAEVNAWSVYPVSEDIQYMAQLNERLYIRTATDKVIVVDKSVFTDHDGDYLFDADFMYQSLKQIGMMKQFHGFDMLMHGEAEISFGYDANNRTDETPSVPVTGNTRSGQMNPMEIMATEVSPRIRYTGPNNLRIDAISLYFTTLGLM